MQETFVTYQVMAFAATIALGMFIGFASDVLRVMRNTFRPSRPMLFFYDLFFWAIMTVITFIVLISSNWGEVRAYVFIGLGFGATIYAVVLSRLCYRVLDRIMQFICVIINTIAKPFIWTFRKVMLICSRCKRMIGVGVERNKKVFRLYKRINFNKNKKE